MNENIMNITSATYLVSPIDGQNIGIQIVETSGKEWSVPLDPDNRHYAEILRQVEAGTLTIKDAE